jgi:hypothetical protein
MESRSKTVSANAARIAGGDAGINNVPQRLVENGNNLSVAQAKINAIGNGVEELELGAAGGAHPLAGGHVVDCSARARQYATVVTR